MMIKGRSYACCLRHSIAFKLAFAVPQGICLLSSSDSGANLSVTSPAKPADIPLAPAYIGVGTYKSRGSLGKITAASLRDFEGKAIANVLSGINHDYREEVAACITGLNGAPTIILPSVCADSGDPIYASKKAFSDIDEYFFFEAETAASGDTVVLRTGPIAWFGCSEPVISPFSYNIIFGSKASVDVTEELLNKFTYFD